MNAILAIDPSSVKMSCAISGVDGEGLTFHTKSLAKHSEKRLPQITDWAEAMVNEAMSVAGLGEVYMFLEKPIVWGSKASTLVLGQVSGATISGLLRSDIDRTLIIVNPSRWKAQELGNGHADKPAIQAHLASVWPHALALATTGKRGKVDQDLCDAACILLYGRTVLRNMLKLESQQPRRIKRSR